MDAPLTELNVIGLILSAVLLAMACVKADRVRAWRTGVNPSAEELSDASFPRRPLASCSSPWPAWASTCLCRDSESPTTRRGTTLS